MADYSPLLGSIAMFGGNFAPKSYMLCQGQILPIANYTALFAILGTTYGGNGTTTFALPDLRGRGPVGQGQGPGLPVVVLGQVSGNNQVTLTSQNLPLHRHAINADVTGFGSVSSPANDFFTQEGDAVTPVNAYSPNTNASMNVQMCGFAGQSQPVSLQNPMLGLNFIIAVQGIFPSRN